MEILSNKLKSMSLVELKAYHYDTQVMIQNLVNQRDLINEEIRRKSIEEQEEKKQENGKPIVEELDDVRN